MYCAFDTVRRAHSTGSWCLLCGRNWMCKYIWVAGLNVVNKQRTNEIKNNHNSCGAKIGAWIKNVIHKTGGRPKILPKSLNAAQWLRMCVRLCMCVCMYVCVCVWCVYVCVYWRYTLETTYSADGTQKHRVKSAQLSPWRYKVAEELRLPAPRL